jgi:hypothetical protein
MALDGLEKKLRQVFPRTTKPGAAAKVHFIRYADDFVITARSHELLEHEVKPLVEEFLAVDHNLVLDVHLTITSPPLKVPTTTFQNRRRRKSVELRTGIKTWRHRIDDHVVVESRE